MQFKDTTPTIPEIDLTPMIDVTFQLIIFFMVIINFSKGLADERVKLPQDELARPAEAPLEHQVVLNLGYVRDKSGAEVSGPVVFYGNGQNYPVMELGELLEQEVQYFKDLGQDPSGITVVVRADAEFPTGLVQEAIKFAKVAGFTKFALRAEQKRE